MQRLALKIGLVNASADISEADLLSLWKQVGRNRLTVRDILAAPGGLSQALTVQGLLWLAKLGLLQFSEPERRP